MNKQVRDMSLKQHVEDMSLKQILDMQDREKRKRKEAFNKMIGTRVELGYKFIDSDPSLCTASFWYHNNSHLQDDMVVVQVTLDKHLIETELRILVSRRNFLKIAKEVEHVESKYKLGRN